MTEPPRRPLLRIKPGVTAPVLPGLRPAKPAAPAKPKPAAKVLHKWKCKPCGAGFDVPADAAPEDAVRCPSCNARLGKAEDFRADPPLLEKLRARPGKG
jgi:DNA-directed RNA polymerase subunit RPC12/RpoP